MNLLEDFKADGLPVLADTTKGNTVARIRCFLREAFRRGWCKEHLAERVRSHKSVHEEKSPYEEAEIALILAAAGKLNGGRSGYAGAPETFRLLCELMLETGMRLARSEEVGLWAYTFSMVKRVRTKAPKVMAAFLSDRLKGAIDNCEWLSADRPFFYGPASNPYSCGQQAYDRMQTIGERCGVADCRPHRLRDTFAKRMLLRGVSMDDLSRLLGHSSVKITERYYAKLVPARSGRLQSVFAQSLLVGGESQFDPLDNAVRNN